MKVENDLEPPVDWQHERASAVALGIHSFIGSLIVFMKLNIAIIALFNIYLTLIPSRVITSFINSY